MHNKYQKLPLCTKEGFKRNQKTPQSLIRPSLFELGEISMFIVNLLVFLYLSSNSCSVSILSPDVEKKIKLKLTARIDSISRLLKLLLITLLGIRWKTVQPEGATFLFHNLKQVINNLKAH